MYFLKMVDAPERDREIERWAKASALPESDMKAPPPGLSVSCQPTVLSSFQDTVMKHPCSYWAVGQAPGSLLSGKGHSSTASALRPLLGSTLTRQFQAHLMTFLYPWKLTKLRLYTHTYNLIYPPIKWQYSYSRNFHIPLLISLGLSMILYVR